MGSNQMACCQCATETELAGKYACGDDARELPAVVTGVRGVGAFDAEEFEHGRLCFEDGATADGADFDGGHGDGYLEVVVITD